MFACVALVVATVIAMLTEALVTTTLTLEAGTPASWATARSMAVIAGSSKSDTSPAATRVIVTECSKTVVGGGGAGGAARGETDVGGSTDTAAGLGDGVLAVGGVGLEDGGGGDGSGVMGDGGGGGLGST